MKESQHTFHIPVMGIGFSIDTPLKVGKYGISSAISIMDDQLIEKMREKYCRNENITYIPITEKSYDYRAKRITAYLNLMHVILDRQIQEMKSEPFLPGSNISHYFDLLPSNHPDRILYKEALVQNDNLRYSKLNSLRNKLTSGAVDVNIMTKLDKTNYDSEGNVLPVEFSDAMASLRGFAESTLTSSVIFSAGMNPRLYGYCSSFNDFFPDHTNYLRKKIILKVSDYRSALIQGKYLAKKGLWVSEFRIESGLNCGGHVFATDGLLMGPILQEFKEKRQELSDELYGICNTALITSGRIPFNLKPILRITVQGGIGTSCEHEWLLNNYNLDSIGWGSPFLLVPEATNVDPHTLDSMVKAKPEDYYRSNASPLGVPFSNLRISTSETQRKSRVLKGRPGSPCYKKYLTFNTEFSVKPVCTASRLYQDLKIKEAKHLYSNPETYEKVVEQIVEKDCLCEGLGASALLVNELKPSHNLKAVAICPGPNLAFFSGIFSLSDMTDHIYGRKNILNHNFRPHVFINELRLYIEFFIDEVKSYSLHLNDKKSAYFTHFQENLKKGIQYYREIYNTVNFSNREVRNTFLSSIWELELRLECCRMVVYN